jgi:glutamate racemase
LTSESGKAIGLIDSGVGGLTIQRQLLEHLPSESTVYFGDTGRAPYGSRSEKTILRYADESLDFLLRNYSIKLVILACHTISAVAYKHLKKRVTVPMVEIIEPTVELAHQATKNGRIGVIGTEALINSETYQKKLKEKKNVDVFTQACPLLMPLSEEGWFTEPETYTIVKKYMAPLVSEGIDTLILGCTHYPPLIGLIRRALPEKVRIIDPAVAVVEKITNMLREGGLEASSTSSSQIYAVTDNPERFKRVGERYFGHTLYYIRLVNLT